MCNVVKCNAVVTCFRGVIHENGMVPKMALYMSLEYYLYASQSWMQFLENE